MAGELGTMIADSRIQRQHADSAFPGFTAIRRLGSNTKRLCDAVRYGTGVDRTTDLYGTPHEAASLDGHYLVVIGEVEDEWGKVARPSIRMHHPHGVGGRSGVDNEDDQLPAPSRANIAIVRSQAGGSHYTSARSPEELVAGGTVWGQESARLSFELANSAHAHRPPPATAEPGAGRAESLATGRGSTSGNTTTAVDGATDGDDTANDAAIAALLVDE
jgi:hypothetical protein